MFFRDFYMAWEWYFLTTWRSGQCLRWVGDPILMPRTSYMGRWQRARLTHGGGLGSDALAEWCIGKQVGGRQEKDIFLRMGEKHRGLSGMIRGTSGENGGGLIFLLGLPGKINTILSYSPISKDSMSFFVGWQARFVGSLCPSTVFKLAWFDLIVYEYYSVLAPYHIFLFSCCKWSDSCLGSGWWLMVIYYFLFVLLVFNL